MVAPSIDQTCLNQPVESLNENNMVSCENESHPSFPVKSFQEEADCQNVEVPVFDDYNFRVVPAIANSSFNRMRKAPMDYKAKQLGSVSSHNSEGVVYPSKQSESVSFRNSDGVVYPQYKDINVDVLYRIKEYLISKDQDYLCNGFTQYLYSNSNYVIVYPEVKVVQRVDKKFYQRKQQQYNMSCKNLVLDSYKVLICRRWQPQSGLKRAFDAVLGGFGAVLTTVDTLKQGVSNINSQSCKLLLIDIVALIISIKDGLLTPSKVISVLMNLYTIHKRYIALFQGEKLIHENRVFMPQSTTITDLVTGLSLLGLPEPVLNAIKTFTALTGKRIFDSEIAIELVTGFFDALIVIIQWIAEPISGYPLMEKSMTDSVIGIIQWLGKSVFTHRRVKDICKVYTQYCTNPQVMFNPEFRSQAVKLYSSAKADPVFLDFVMNSNNKYFTTTWNLFESNIIRSISAFEESRREEPICFVFEGPAGSGKSAVLNQFVDVLRHKGYTTYCHAIPASEDGKDFYDDYENQDVFVMDDIGIQGKSQWRYIVNFVSPVKYPLPCATASKKNTKFFNSKIIVCTTNHFMDLSGFTSADCITEPSALFRRCHVIKVEKDATTLNFEQLIKYYKYSHMDPIPRWENALLYHNADPEIPVSLVTRELPHDDKPVSHSVQVFLLKLLTHIERSNARDAKHMVIGEDGLNDITSEVDQYFDAQSIFAWILKGDGYVAAGCTFVQIISEWLNYLFAPVIEMAKKGISTIIQQIVGISNGVVDYASSWSAVWNYFRKVEVSIWGLSPSRYLLLMSGFLMVTLSWNIWNAFGVDDDTLEGKFDLGEVDVAVKNITGETWEAQSDAPDRVAGIKKFVKLLVVKQNSHNRDLDEVSHGVVSANNLLLPAHLNVKDCLIDVYNSYEHFKNGHKELENQEVKLLRAYPASDLAVYTFKNTIPLYKKCHNLFGYNKVARCTNPLLYLVNSTGIKPVLYGSSVVRNNEMVKYSKYAVRYEHEVDSGFITNFSRSGACGTVLVSADDGIIGFHVAGGVEHGFCVQPSLLVKEEIRELMLTGYEPKYEIDEKIRPSISGVRLRYENKLEYNHVGGETALVKTVFHRENHAGIRELEKALVDDRMLSSVPIDKVDKKAPPNFKDKNGSVKQKLSDLALKTFKHQGVITVEERRYIKDCLRSMMTRFDDLDDQEVAFGGDYVKALNKDSSNGAFCEKGKESYFDFENKVISDKARKLFEKVDQQARNKEYDYEYFVSREALKDELRKESKIDTPRTFRVMPLGHIWWTKKIFGKLLKHFAQNRHETGVCVGFNPFKDVDVLAKKLLLEETLGDADFGKWDGSVIALLIELIFEVFGEFYDGNNGHILEWLCVTISKSMVIINDELWATTHGIPSGTWVTLLINCLINKCITALTIFRNKEDPTVEDFYSVVDYVMGDDKIMGSSGPMAKVFNLFTVKEVAESLGMDCTNGDKTPITSPSQSFDKLSFLKRHLREHPTLSGYVGLLSVDTIMNTLQWMDCSKDVDEVLGGKARSVQVEAYIHSPSLFKRLTNIIAETLPFQPLFTEAQVIKILQSDDGYEKLNVAAGKDVSWLIQ